MITLNATQRDLSVSAQNLRDQGRIPCVVYGAGIQSTPISVGRVEFEKAFREAGESSVVSLSIDGIGTKEVLVHDLDRDRIKGTFLHVDFLAINMTKPVEINVPLEFVGEAPAVKLGGVLVKVAHEITITVLPKEIPHSLTIDLSVLTEMHQSIHAKDIVLPKSATLEIDGETIIASVTEQQEEQETAPADITAIEVEKKGKEEESSDE